MELIVAILLAGPLGYLIPMRRRALVAYLGSWAIVLPVQTIVVHNQNPAEINWQYAVVQVLVLSLGLGLNRYGSTLRERRLAPAR